MVIYINIIFFNFRKIDDCVLLVPYLDRVRVRVGRDELAEEQVDGVLFVLVSEGVIVVSLNRSQELELLRHFVLWL